MNNYLIFRINSFFMNSILMFTKIFFYKVLFTKFIFFRSLLLFLQYDILFQFPRFYFLPKKLKRFTVLRSPHVHKKSRDQYETELVTMKLIFNDLLNIVYYHSYLSIKKLSQQVFHYGDCSATSLTSNNYLLSKWRI